MQEYQTHEKKTAVSSGGPYFVCKFFRLHMWEHCCTTIKAGFLPR